jgi:cobyrinic acid a,c-diamide synthase
MRKIPRVVVAGLRGGSGKTTLSVGLTAALAARGLTVIPFKKGPDYIDAGWLGAAAGRDCYNLDQYLAGKPLGSFISHAHEAGMAVIEGNRGLFDGMDAEGTFSTSRLARELKAPVILIIDATKTTRTNAAVISGIKRFEKGLDLACIVLNNVGGRRHENLSRETIEKYARVPVVGAIPRFERSSKMPERHMGLIPWQEHASVKEAIASASEIVEKYVDVEAIIRLARKAPALRGSLPHRAKPPEFGPVIGIMRDSAFQFYYPENFEELERLGARMVEVSALTERELPEMDALYLGGGFPETHAIELGKNKSFMKSLREHARAGLPIYAECGGLMYLGDTIELMGRKHKMAGVLPARFSMNVKPHAHGYKEVSVSGRNPVYRPRTVLRGHEFHYSELTNAADLKANSEIKFAFRVKRGKGIAGNMEGITYKNVLATYNHTHALGTPEWAEGMIAAANEYRKKRR